MWILGAFVIFTVLLYPAQGREDNEDPRNWPRWEMRTINCDRIKTTDQCILVAPNARTPRDPAKYRCRREPMPQNNWNQLAKDSKTRLACPIACEPNADLSVLVKSPRKNPNCVKYYTYGKYRDHEEGEWYLWLTEPCYSNITTHCRFKDVPQHVPKQKLTS